MRPSGRLHPTRRNSATSGPPSTSEKSVPPAMQGTWGRARGHREPPLRFSDRLTGALLDQLAQLRVDDDVAATRELDLLEERVVVRVADLDAVEAGADVFPFALPVAHLADQHVVHPDGRVRHVALDAHRDRVLGQRVRAGRRRQRGQRDAEQDAADVVHDHGMAPPAAGVVPAFRRTRARIVSPEVCTSANVIMVLAVRERACATAAAAARVRTRISTRPAETRVSSAAETAPMPRRLFTNSGIAAGSTTSASTVTARRSPAGVPPPPPDGAAPASRPARSAPSCVRHWLAPSAAFSASTNTRAVAARSATVLPAGAATSRTFARHEIATRPVPRTMPSGTTSDVTSAACSSDARAAACAAAPALVSPGSSDRARTPADDRRLTRAGRRAGQ